jgi:hypothetical protein
MRLAGHHGEPESRGRGRVEEVRGNRDFGENDYDSSIPACGGE